MFMRGMPTKLASLEVLSVPKPRQRWRGYEAGVAKRDRGGLGAGVRCAVVSRAPWQAPTAALWICFVLSCSMPWRSCCKRRSLLVEPCWTDLAAAWLASARCLQVLFQPFRYSWAEKLCICMQLTCAQDTIATLQPRICSQLVSSTTSHSGDPAV